MLIFEDLFTNLHFWKCFIDLHTCILRLYIIMYIVKFKIKRKQKQNEPALRFHVIRLQLLKVAVVSVETCYNNR